MPERKEMNKLSHMDAAYIAGIIDGEGTFNLVKYRGRMSPILRIPQVDPRLCYWLKETIGLGHVSQSVRKTTAGNTVFLYSLKGWYHCVRLALLLYPLLIVKQEQVDRVFGDKLDSLFLKYLTRFRMRGVNKWEQRKVRREPQVPWNKGKKYTPEEKEAVTLGIKRYWTGLYDAKKEHGYKKEQL